MINIKNIHRDKKYLLAVSGGIDSMVMAHVFKQQDIYFQVAHCNFGLRAEESDLDEQLVKCWCEENGITFHRKRFDTNQFAQENKMGIQQAARELRYAYFKDLLKEHDLCKLATAHHAADQIETVLFNWCRGTGLQGLCGMPLVNDFVVRPMLHVSKQDILAYALAHKIQYREDSSNAKLDYTRNKFRHQIVPVLEDMFPSFSENMLANIERMKETNLVFQQGIQGYRKKLLEQRGKDIYLAVLSLQSVAALSTVLYELIKEFGFSFDQTLQVLQLMDSQSGALVQSQTHKIIRNRKHLIITKIETQSSDLILIDHEDKHIQTSGFGLQFTKLGASEWSKEKNSELIFVGMKELVYPLVLRKWRQGDYFYPLGLYKKKKVARLLIDEKIPLHEKDQVWVLESDKKIIWVIGHRQDHRFAVKEQDQTILKITRTRY